MVETQQATVKEVPKEPTFNIVYTKSELIRNIEQIEENKDFQTFTSYHKGKEDYETYKALVEALKAKTE
jgi:hypothetical protein